MGSFSKYMEISKVDKEKRLVTGYASTPTVDSDDEIVDLKAIKAALPGYMEWGNIREMHAARAVGTAHNALVDDKGLLLTAYVSKGAPECWEKVLDGTLKGFSIGGNVINKVGNKITELELLEISLVDRPANPDCRFEVVKMYKNGVPVNSQQISGITLEKIADAHNPDLSVEERTWFRKFVSFLKGETALSTPEFGSITDAPNPHSTGSGDGLSSPAGAVTQAPVDHEGGGSAKSPFHAHEWARHLEPLEAGADLKPYGEVEYADPGHQEDKKHRYPVDTEEHIRSAWSYIHKPENQKPYTAEQVASIKSKIEAAWKDKIDAKGPPEAEKVAKGMNEVSDMGYAFATLRDVQRRLNFESELEQDPKDKEFSDRAGTIATTLAALMAEVATHEGGEATTLTDEDDILFRQWTGAELAMATQATTTKRFSAAFKEHMGKCAGHLGKAVECHGEAMKGIKAMKTAIMEQHAAAKAAGTVPVFKAEDMLDHIHKCMGALTDMGDRHDLAAHHLDKCMKAAGGDAESRNEGDGSSVEAPGFGGVSGTTSPEGLQGSGGDAKEDIYAWLGEKSASPALMKQFMEAQVELAYLKGQQAAMASQPAGAFKAKTFDFGTGGASTPEAERETAIFKGVNFRPTNEAEAKTAVGKAIGNLIGLGGANPAFDPNFKGAAGAGRR